MKAITEEQVEAVAAATDIVDVVGSYIPLERSGATYSAQCPFHREDGRSFRVSPVQQAYYCFGCGAGGSVFKFVMEYERVRFEEAVRIVEGKIKQDADTLKRAIMRCAESGAEFYIFDKCFGNYTECVAEKRGRGARIWWRRDGSDSWDYVREMTDPIPLSDVVNDFEWGGLVK